MAQHDDKRLYRKLKRDVKRAGNRCRRHHLKSELHNHPEEAAHTEFDFGKSSSAAMNGNDRDARRQRSAQEKEENE
jgi:hypothetical protein